MDFVNNLISPSIFNVGRVGIVEAKNKIAQVLTPLQQKVVIVAVAAFAVVAIAYFVVRRMSNGAKIEKEKNHDDVNNDKKEDADIKKEQDDFVLKFFNASFEMPKIDIKIQAPTIHELFNILLKNKNIQPETPKQPEPLKQLEYIPNWQNKDLRPSQNNQLIVYPIKPDAEVEKVKNVLENLLNLFKDKIIFNPEKVLKLNTNDDEALKKHFQRIAKRTPAFLLNK